MQELNFDKEIMCHTAGFDVVVGVDEAGRGPLAGPVVAAATTVRNFQYLISNFQPTPEEERLWRLVRDSKTLSEKQREKLYDFVREHFFVGVGIVYPETIDRINILEATFLAMREAVGELRRDTRHEPARSDMRSVSGRESSSRGISMENRRSLHYGRDDKASECDFGRTIEMTVN